MMQSVATVGITLYLIIFAYCLGYRRGSRWVDEAELAALRGYRETRAVPARRCYQCKHYGTLTKAKGETVVLVSGCALTSTALLPLTHSCPEFETPK